ARMEDDVPLEVKKERLFRLNQLQDEISRRRNEKLRGQVVEVLVEGESKKNAEILSGRTRTNKLVNFRGPKSLIGKFAHVRISEPLTYTLKAEWVETESAAKAGM